MEMRDCKLYRALTELPFHKVATRVRDMLELGRDVRIVDALGATFLHAAVERAEVFNEPRALPAVYGLCLAGVDVNAQDAEGDTALHRLVRQGPATWRVLTAIIRCGGDVSLKNKQGETVHDLLVAGGEACERTLLCYSLLQPGLKSLLQTDHPVDEQSVESLLKGWCRTKEWNNGRLECLSAHAQQQRSNITSLIKKYGDTNEYCLYALAGQTKMMTQLMKRGGVDVNARDHLNSSNWPDDCLVPQPLLAVAVEQENHNVIDVLLRHNVNTSVYFTPRNGLEATPLFLGLLSYYPPFNNLHILSSILKESDLTRTNKQGQNALFEAVRVGMPVEFIKSLLLYGAKLESRDQQGRTVRDYAQSLEKDAYVECFDNYIIGLVQEKNTTKLESLVMGGYDHIADLINATSPVTDKLREKFEDDRFYRDVANFFKSLPKMQRKCARLLVAVDEEDIATVDRLHNVQRAQNRCGHNVLHRALLCSDCPDNSSFCCGLIRRFPLLVHRSDNMGRTPLHYAYLLRDCEHPVVQLLLDAQVSATPVDALGNTPLDYSTERMTSQERGHHEDLLRRQETRAHLHEIHFGQHLERAIKAGEMAAVKRMLDDVGERLDLTQHSQYLFDCIDHGQPEIAAYLIQRGCQPDVWKQYDECDPGNSICKTKQCRHVVVSLHQRALQEGYASLASLIESA